MSAATRTTVLAAWAACTLFVLFAAASSLTYRDLRAWLSLPGLLLTVCACLPQFALIAISKRASSATWARQTVMCVALLCLVGLATVLGWEVWEMRSIPAEELKVRQGMVLPFLFWLLESAVVAAVSVAVLTGVPARSNESGEAESL